MEKFETCKITWSKNELLIVLEKEGQKITLPYVVDKLQMDIGE